MGVMVMIGEENVPIEMNVLVGGVERGVVPPDKSGRNLGNLGNLKSWRKKLQ